MGSADEQDLARLYARNKSDNKRCWEIKRNDIFGRYVVATCDIAPGEVVFSEQPLEVGPNHNNEVLCCVACHRHMSRPSGCPACDLPLCGLNCPLRHKHRSLECPLFENSRLNFAFRNEAGDYELSEIPYDAIMILRLLLMRDQRPEDWKTFRLLQCSLGEWREMHPWEENQEEKVKIIRENLKQQKFSREDILEVIAICCTNTFSKYLDPNSEGEGAGLGQVGTKMRAVFPMTSMLSHSCHPNVEQTISDHSGGLGLDMVTVRPVAAGEQIYISYTELLAPSLIRQHTLLTNKLFLCQCDRCSDPRELDTFGSGLKCTSCLRRSEASPGTLLTTDDVDTWQCDLESCGATVPASTVQRLVFRLWEQVEAAVDSPEAGVKELEAALAKFSRVLHPGHAGLARIKYSLCGLYGRSPGYELFKLSEKHLQRKRTLCEEMLTYLDLIQPGFSCRRGMILYELHTVLLILGRSSLGSDKARARRDLRRSAKCLRECLAVLGLQASSTFPGQLYTAVSASRSQVEEFIRTSLKQ